MDVGAGAFELGGLVAGKCSRAAAGKCVSRRCGLRQEEPSLVSESQKMSTTEK